MADMTNKIFENELYGKLALKKLGEVPDNFRLYEAALIDNDNIRVKGAEFRIAKAGPQKGKLAIMIPKTIRTAYITTEELKSARNLK